MIERSRRQVLGALPATLLGVGGCSTLDADATATAAQTEQRVVPTPSDSCAVTSLPDAEYPALPDDLTASRAAAFAETFEKRYVEATITAHPRRTFNGFDGWQRSVREERASGYLVAVEVAADYAESRDDESATDLGSERVRSWYFVAADVAARAARHRPERLADAEWETVACR